MLCVVREVLCADLMLQYRRVAHPFRGFAMATNPRLVYQPEHQELADRSLLANDVVGIVAHVLTRLHPSEWKAELTACAGSWRSFYYDNRNVHKAVLKQSSSFDLPISFTSLFHYIFPS